MSYRHLLFALSCFAGSALAAWVGLIENMAVGNPNEATVLTAVMFGGFFGGVYFFIHALPGRPEPAPSLLRFVPSPEVAFEFSAAEGAPAAPASAEAVHAALAAGFGFTAAADPDGWVRLTGTIGPPRWVKTDTGDVTGERQYARLTLRSDADPAALRPEDVALVSTETNLTKNASVALAAALGPLRVRIRGDQVWLPVSPDGLFSLLAVRLLQTRPPVTAFREGHRDGV